MGRGRMLRASLVALALTVASLLAPVSAGAQTQTVVSLTFDDGWADQYETRSVLAAHGMKGTYYVNTGRTGTSGFLSWAQLAALDADGHEVTGHTLDHVDLVAATATEARRQVCDDRQNLVSRGFVAKSFAYPYGEYNTTAKSIVQECGYASGRGAFGLRNITSTTDTRPLAGPIPPPDRYAILTPCCIRSNVTLEQLQNYIVQAENNGGGWVPLVLHRICENCGGDSPAPSMTPATFQAFVEWLSPRVSRNTVVRTVGQVVSGDAQPATTSARCNASTCAAWYAGPVSVSLEATDGGSGVAAVRYTLDGSDPTVSSPLYTGPFTVWQTTTVKFRSWDNGGNVEPVKSQLVRIDATAPVSSILCNGTLCSAGWYAAPVSVALSATDDASGVAAIRHTLDGSEPTAASPVYTGPFTVSQTSTIRYRAWDMAGNVEATNSQPVHIDTAGPTVAITYPASGARVRGVVRVAAMASDSGSGVLRVSFYANGQFIGSKAGGGTVVVNWNTRKLKGQYTLTAVAEDAAGNATTSAPVTVTVG